MADAPNIPEIPADWTEPEQWVWARIAAGETADLNARDRNDDPAFEDLDPMEANGWTQNRRLRVKFLQTILFYGHKLVGWVLGSFIVAGLAGTTQRERD